MKKVALLSFLTESYPDFSKKELYSKILCGEVAVDGEKIRNPKRKISPDVRVAFTGERYVSRGGIKLEHALHMWAIPVEGKIFLDAGASTGGFTDCLLQHGASFIHAVDVGYNQLAYKLRTDERVNVREQTNIMKIDSLDPAPHAAVVDLSFRSLRRAAHHIISLTSERVTIALMKPQYEYQSQQNERQIHGSEERKDKSDFRGVVAEAHTVAAILLSAVEDIREEGVEMEAITPSPIYGRRGNSEFLLLLKSSSAFGDEGRAEKNRLGERGGEEKKLIIKSVEEAFDTPLEPDKL